MKAPHENGARDVLSIARPVHRYATLGYPVLPCRPDKLPATPHGLKDATTDVATLKRWLAEHPGGCWGLLPPAGVLVLDADTADAAAQLERDYSELQHAPCCRTPRGGAHLYIRWPDNTPPPATRTGALPDVDLRGLGRAYLLVPPSRTAHGAYTWQRPLVAPAALPVASAVLVAVLAPQRPAPTPPRRLAPPVGGSYGKAALQREHDAVASAPVGQRNYTLNKAAFTLGRLVAGGALERAEVEEALLAAAGTCGLPQQESVRTIKSGLEAGQSKPRVSTPPVHGSAGRPVQSASHCASHFARFFVDEQGPKCRLMQAAKHTWRGRP